MCLRFFVPLLTVLLLTAGPRRSLADDGSEVTFLIRAWQSEDGLPSNNVRSVVQAADGYLWVATGEGVVRFDGVRFASMCEDRPRALFALEYGEVWIALVRGGLWRWSGHEMIVVWPDPEDEQTLRVVKNVVRDARGQVFVECADGVYQTNGIEPPVKVAQMPDQPGKSASNSVMGSPGDLLELTDRRGWRWASGGEGLTVSKPGSKVRALDEFADGKRVAALMEDHEGNVWAATNGGGLFQIRPRRVQVIDMEAGFKYLKARAVLEDRAGALWVANRSGGIEQFQHGRVTLFSFDEKSQSRQVSSICEDRDGVLWVVKENSAVYRKEGEGFVEITGDTPWTRRALAIISDADGAIWVGGADGVARWKDGVVKNFSQKDGLPQHPTSTLALDAQQQVWVGTAKGAVYRGRESFTKVGETGGAMVSSLLPDKSGAVWATTLGGGLFLFQKGGQARFATPDLRLTCVLEDDFGHLWLGSLAGVFRVAKSDLLDVAAGRREEPAWLHLDRADGMISSECSGGFQPAGWKRRDGTLIFPTVRGIVSVRPDGFELNEVVPEVRIEETLANGQVKSGAEIETGPGRTRLEFRYAALSFTAPEKARFRTRLEGLQDVWQETGPLRSVAYEAVPPGDYVFRVMAANNDGVWSEGDASITVRVLPHYWETAWFRTVAVFMLLGLAVGIGMLISRARARGRVLRLEAQTARLIERERIAQDLHDDLGASLTEISLIAGLAAEDANAAKIPVIAVKAQQLVSTLDEIVWAVNPRHDTLASFVEYLNASAAELLDAAGIALRLEIAENLPEVTLDSVQRHALFLAAREALNNAVKHSGASEVRLGIHFNADGLVITIRDNGQGIAAEDSPLSEGLRNMQARLTGIGGTCQIESDAGGTVVVFSLGLRHKA